MTGKVKYLRELTDTMKTLDKVFKYKNSKENIRELEESIIRAVKYKADFRIKELEVSNDREDN